MKTNSQPSRQRTLLLVEDDELVRDAMTRLFVREGYLVLTASTGHDAIGVLRTPSSSIDVVLLDVGLPDVSGADLCAGCGSSSPTCRWSCVPERPAKKRPTNYAAWASPTFSANPSPCRIWSPPCARPSTMVSRLLPRTRIDRPNVRAPLRVAAKPLRPIAPKTLVARVARSDPRRQHGSRQASAAPGA